MGLSGGIGAGKTLALAEFARLGARTISLDEVSREVSRPGTASHRRIVRAFGRSVLGPGGEINRKGLAALVFARPELRKRLERLTHPAILAELGRRARKAPPGVVVADVPLLFEGGHEGRFDLTLFVSAPPRNRRARVMRRDRLSAAEVARRMRAQLPDRVKERRADLVVLNDGSRKDFKSKVAQYYQAFELISRSAAK